MRAYFSEWSNVIHCGSKGSDKLESVSWYRIEAMESHASTIDISNLFKTLNKSHLIFVQNDGGKRGTHAYALPRFQLPKLRLGRFQLQGLGPTVQDSLQVLLLPNRRRPDACT